MRKTLIDFLVLLFAGLLMNQIAFGAQPRTRGDRLIGHGITEGAIGFGNAFALARDAGLEFIELPFAWDAVETASGTYGNKNLQIANVFFPAQGIKVFLTVNPIDTNNLRMPGDLKHKAFDDPEVIERYNRLIDYVFAQIPNLELIGFGIGNEIDAYLANDPSRWRQYQKFYESTRQYVKSKRPGLKVGTKAMMYGYIFNHTTALINMNRHSDLIMVTYYPLKDGFRLREPSVVHEHLKRLTTLYEGRPISMLEAGYPSSSYLKSSQKKQAAFIRELFTAWDHHRAQIRHINFMWLHDVSDAKLTEFETYYGFSSKAFIEFLATLGLRTYEGEGKLAYKELKRQAYLRDWNVQNPDQPAASPAAPPAGKTREIHQPADLPVAKQEYVKIGFADPKDLFHCPAGSFVSLDHDSPHTEMISMRWNYRNGDDWMWCLKKVDRRKLANATMVSFWLKSDQKGPVFLRIDESAGESFFVMAHSGLDWNKFEFYLDGFSIDDKTRQDGVLDPEEIASLILADPPGAHNSKQPFRTVWISDLIFR